MCVCAYVCVRVYMCVRAPACVCVYMCVMRVCKRERATERESVYACARV